MPQPPRLSRTRDLLSHLRIDRWMPASNPHGSHAHFVHPTKPGRISVDLSEPQIPTATLRSIYVRANWDW